MDELDWIRVIDHSQYLCRSWQKLYFPARVCRLVLTFIWGYLNFETLAVLFASEKNNFSGYQFYRYIPSKKFSWGEGVWPSK